MSLVEAVLAGQRLALARLLTQVENQTPEGWQALDELFLHTGYAHLVGITGAPGTGKSSLVNRLALHYRHPADGQSPRKVAVVAVDPSSPFTGGALLGDRVRMRDVAADPGVFIRSMATRGALGGLARTTAEVVRVLDAAGYQMILIETIGAGQAEVDIARLAHTVIVVEAPGLGDDIQAIKAGIMEIADILVVNKADRPGVENTERALRAMLEMAPLDWSFRKYPGYHHRTYPAPIQGKPTGEDRQWQVPVLRTVAIQGTGLPELACAIDTHAEYLHHTSEWQQRERMRLQTELDELVQMELVERWRSRLAEEVYKSVLQRLFDHQLSPHQALQELLQ